eukprot:NODE_61_length_26588_cov_1.146778.p1 type:complete len:1075 gc:universal NODE_61_length_26588_cov_1.146778:9135-5911(-)
MPTKILKSEPNDMVPLKRQAINTTRQNKVARNTLSSTLFTQISDPPSEINYNIPESLDGESNYTCTFTNKLRIMQWNCRGYKRVLNQQELNNLLELEPHILLLQESKNYKYLPHINNYTQWDLPNSNLHHKQHLFIHNSVTSVNKIKFFDNCYIFKINRQNIAFTYIPFHYIRTRNIEYIKSILNEAISHNAFICGDLNFNILEIDSKSDLFSKQLKCYLLNKSYVFHNVTTSTMVNTNKILDHFWSHSSLQHAVKSLLTIQRPDKYTSDHWPSIIELETDKMMLSLEKINWKKLKIPKFRKQYQSMLQNLIKKYNDNLLDSINVNEIDNFLTSCVLTADKQTLGIIPNFPECRILTSNLDSINKYIKRKQQTYSRVKSRRRRIILLKEIKQCRKKYNSEMENQVYQNHLEVLEEINKDSTNAYHKLCKIKNSNFNPNRIFCNEEEMIAYQKNHFDAPNHSWNKKHTSEEQINRAYQESKSLFSCEKIRKEARRLNTRKSAGGILPNTSIKFLPSNGIKVLKHLFQQAYTHGDLPESWCKSSICEIYKNKGSHSDPKFYRPISLLPTVRKIYEKILYYFKLKYILIPSFRQHGFCQSRSTLTQLHFVLNTIKQFKRNGDVYLASLDLSSAFDHINWDDIEQNVVNLFTPIDCNALRSLIVNQSLYLKRDSLKQTIEMKQGVPQGGTLSPLLFSFIIDRILSELDYDDSKIAICLYADDIFLCANNPNYLQLILNNITSKLKDHNFKANPNKYQICASSEYSFVVDNQELESLKFIKYLGIHINCDGIDYDAELVHKNKQIASVQKKIHTEEANKLFHGQPLFVKGVIESILSYGLPLWDVKYLERLESIRKGAVNGVFRHSRLIHEYLCKFLNSNELYNKNRISLETQLRNCIYQLQSDPRTPLNYIEILKFNTSFCETVDGYTPLSANTLEELQLTVEERLQDMWDENRANRGSKLKTTSNLLILLKKNRYNYTYSHSTLKLGVLFLMGRMPFRGNDEYRAICEYCEQPFDSTAHFEEVCLVENTDLATSNIYNTFKNGSETEIFDLLKKLKKSTFGEKIIQETGADQDHSSA